MNDGLALGSAAAEMLLFAGACVLLLAATVRLPARALLYGAVGLFIGAALLTWALVPAADVLTYYGLYSSSRLTSVIQIGVLLSCAAALAYSGV